MFDWIFDSLSKAFDPALRSMLVSIGAKVNAQLADTRSFISMTPESAFGQTWKDLLRAGTTVIVPFAICIVGFMVAAELYSLYCKNNGKLDLELVSSTALKFILPFLLITHTYDLMQVIWSLFTNMSSALLNQIAWSETIDIGDLENAMAAMADWGFFEKVGAWFMLAFVNIGFQLVGLCVWVIFYARLFHITILWIFSPIPFATMPSSEHSSIFKNFIKTFCALLLQGAMMVFCVGIYAALIKHSAFDVSNPDIGWGLLGYSILLLFTLFKTERMSQRMLGTF